MVGGWLDRGQSPPPARRRKLPPATSRSPAGRSTSGVISERRDRDDPLAGPEPAGRHRWRRADATTRPRWPAYGASNSSIRSSLPRGSPASAHATMCLSQKSPTAIGVGIAEHGSEHDPIVHDADAGEQDEAATSLDRVVAGVELVDRRARGGRVCATCRRGCARPRSGWNHQYGCLDRSRGDGGSESRRGPGARSPSALQIWRHDRRASPVVTRWPMTVGNKAWNNAVPPPMRNPGWLRCAAMTTGMRCPRSGRARRAARPAAAPGRAASRRRVPTPRRRRPSEPHHTCTVAGPCGRHRGPPPAARLVLRRRIAGARAMHVTAWQRTSIEPGGVRRLPTVASRPYHGRSPAPPHRGSNAPYRCRDRARVRTRVAAIRHVTSSETPPALSSTGRAGDDGSCQSRSFASASSAPGSPVGDMNEVRST